MKAARLVVLGVALAAGLGAAYLMMGTKEPEPVRVVAAPPPPVTTDQVLVAARDLSIGAVVTDADMRWDSWPRDHLPAGAITRGAQPKAMDDVKGLFVRSEVLAGEPLRMERLNKGAGFLSAVLPGGMRAIAIDLADLGKSAAGGFILPNDRVDVIRTFRPDDTSNMAAMASETILRNIRVLAIGPTIKEKQAEQTVFGSTATLEVAPDQAERLILAQRTGTLTLALRSVTDANKDDSGKPPEQPQTMTIIRFGNATQSRVR